MAISKPLPFILDVHEDIPKFRADTFWTKEPETIQWIDDYLQTDSTTQVFIDVGANIGIYTLYAASVNSKVEIIAVEPINRTFTELEKNIALNSRTDQIKTAHVALSTANGVGVMTRIDDRVGSSGAQLVMGNGEDGVSTNVMTGDRLLRELATNKFLAVQSVMIKIDTDGNELDVLSGFGKAFSDGVIATVLVETIPTNVDEINQFLVSRGLSEETKYLKLEGHSNFRRIAKGNKERTKIYSVTS